LDRGAPRRRPRSSASVAGVVGAGGGGTLVVLVAQNLPDDFALKPWLLLLSPWVSVAIGGLWLWVRQEVDQWRRERARRGAIRQARALLDAALVNPHTSDSHKAEIRKHLEELELLLVRSGMEEIRRMRSEQ
jgi:hypothetical protein